MVRDVEEDDLNVEEEELGHAETYSDNYMPSKRMATCLSLCMLLWLFGVKSLIVVNFLYLFI